MSAPSAGVRDVIFLNVPTAAFLAGLRHLEDLTHELRLLDGASRSGVVDVPADLATTIHEILDSYETPHREVWRQTREALEAGKERVDLTVTLPPEAVEASRRLLDLLERAEELCRKGTLMTLPPDDDIVELRRWTYAELERQLAAGDEPRPHP